MLITAGGTLHVQWCTQLLPAEAVCKSRRDHEMDESGEHEVDWCVFLATQFRIRWTSIAVTSARDDVQCFIMRSVSPYKSGITLQDRSVAFPGYALTLRSRSPPVAPPSVGALAVPCRSRARSWSPPDPGAACMQRLIWNPRLAVLLKINIPIFLLPPC